MEIIINENYRYIECLNDIEFYNKLEEYLNEGYSINETIYLAVELKRENNYILLNHIQIDNGDGNIKESIKNKYKEYEISYPDYSNTLLNIISGIRRNYGCESKYQIDNSIFDRKYKNIVILILDGLGTNVLNKNLEETDFLRKNYYKDVNSIYPSTTAAATTSIISGLTPYESGWTGWQNYIKELNKNIVLFNGKDYYKDEFTGVTGYNKLPYKTFCSDSNVPGEIIQPDFKTNKRDLKDLLKRSLKSLKKKKSNIQYIYHTEPDSMMHMLGTGTKEVKDLLNTMNKDIEEYASKLPNDTLLIVSADHGHIDVEPLYFADCKILMNMLNRRPSNDGRCATFSVKDEYKTQFEKLFNQLFKNVYKLYKSEDAIKLGFFGNKDDIKHERIDDFLADYVAVATNKYYFEMHPIAEAEIKFKSHHAGITKEEMKVPVILFKR